MCFANRSARCRSFARSRRHLYRATARCANRDRRVRWRGGRIIGSRSRCDRWYSGGRCLQRDCGFRPGRRRAAGIRSTYASSLRCRTLLLRARRPRRGRISLCDPARSRGCGRGGPRRRKFVVRCRGLFLCQKGLLGLAESGQIRRVCGGRRFRRVLVLHRGRLSLCRRSCNFGRSQRGLNEVAVGKNAAPEDHQQEERCPYEACASSPRNRR